MHRSRSTCAADYDFPPVPFAGLPSLPARTAAQLLLGDERTSPDQVKTCSRVDEGVAIGKVSVLQLSLVANTAWLVQLVHSGGRSIGQQRAVLREEDEAESVVAMDTRAPTARMWNSWADGARQEPTDPPD